MPESKISKKQKLTEKQKKILKIAGMSFGILLVILSFIGLLFFRVYRQAKKVETSARNLVAAGKAEDLNLIKQELANTKQSVAGLKTVYKGVSWLKFAPYLGSFISDGQHGINAAGHGLDAADLLITTIEPYADVIGLANGGDANSPDETTQERLDFIIKTIPEILPQVDAIETKVISLQKEIDQIDPNHYPQKIGNQEVQSLVKKAVDAVDLGADFVTNGKPLLAAAPYILGVDEPRTYLVLFQNDKELRPTGGFLTAYSIAKVNGGKFEPVISNDIYNLDNLYTPSIPAADPIVTYLKGPYLVSKNYRLRDINWSPDFAESMKLFLDEAETAGIGDIDGIIAVDTQLLVNLLDALGPIGVPGYGNFSTDIIPECNCPQVIYELESFADVEGPIVWSENEPGKIVYAPENYDNRKEIIGPLMNSVLSNSLGQSKENLPKLFEAGVKSVLEKNVMFYLLDGESQAAVESFGIAGKVEEFDGDYLMVNDANLGGRKSNLYVTQEVVQEITVAKDGSVEKTVTITYKNPEKQDGWLNSVLPNWVRIYVPKGSELIDISGLEDKKDPYEDLDKTVFAGYFELRPEGLAKVTATYKLPFKVADEYKMLIQKQPGKQMPLYQVLLNKNQEEFFLKTDQELKFEI